MSELTELGQVLHEEHFRILVSICGLENRVNGPAAAVPLDPGRGEDKQQLEDLMGALGEVLGHHAFEEALIFPLTRRGGVAVLHVQGLRPSWSLVRDWMGSGEQELSAGEPGRGKHPSEYA